MFNDLFKFLLLGPLVICATMSLCARAEGPFASLEVSAAHDKHKSILCYSGGFSRNLTGSLQAAFGWQSGDFYALAFYEKSECVSSGNKKDDERAYHVRSRIEEVGVKVGVRFDLF